MIMKLRNLVRWEMLKLFWFSWVRYEIEPDIFHVQTNDKWIIVHRRSKIIIIIITRNFSSWCHDNRLLISSLLHTISATTVNDSLNQRIIELKFYLHFQVFLTWCSSCSSTAVFGAFLLVDLKGIVQLFTIEVLNILCSSNQDLAIV